MYFLKIKQYFLSICWVNAYNSWNGIVQSVMKHSSVLSLLAACTVLEGYTQKTAILKNKMIQKIHLKWVFKAQIRWQIHFVSSMHFINDIFYGPYPWLPQLSEIEHQTESRVVTFCQNKNGISL